MNVNFLNIIKRIVSEQGEAILGDPQRLRTFIVEYAKNEPQQERLAFGRCIEQGCYPTLKGARTAEERKQTKAALLQKVQSATGMDQGLCAGSLDLLEAAMAGTAAAPQAAPVSTMHFSQVKTISRKPLVFGIAGALGGFAGELISEIFRGDNASSFLEHVLNVAGWASFIGLGISIGLLAAQHIYLKKKPNIASLIKTAILGIGIGAAAGGLAQIAFAFTSDISTLVEVISRIICWGILGWGIGWGVSFFVPNYPKKRAMLSGFLGGAVGGAVFRATFLLPFDSGVLGRIVGISILGFFIGLTISLLEEVLREAWLTIVYAKNETATVALGQKPVAFGSSREADVFIPRDKNNPDYPPIRAIVKIENAKVVMEDKVTNQIKTLENGAQIDLGKLSFIVNVKTERTNAS